MVLYAAPHLGLPALVEEARLCSAERVLLLAVAMLPLDMLFTVCGRYIGNLILAGASWACMAGMVLAAVENGYYHGYLMIEFTRYNASVEVTNSIIDHFKPNSYTIVSPVDELYQVMGYGYHEELWSFVQKVESESYTLPTEYVFLFIEKKAVGICAEPFFPGPVLAGRRKIR